MQVKANKDFQDAAQQHAERATNRLAAVQQLNSFKSHVQGSWILIGHLAATSCCRFLSDYKSTDAANTDTGKAAARPVKLLAD